MSAGPAAKKPRVVETVADHRVLLAKMQLRSEERVQFLFPGGRLYNVAPSELNYMLRAILGQLYYSWRFKRADLDDRSNYLGNDGVPTLEITLSDGEWTELCEFLSTLYTAHLEQFLRAHDVEAPRDEDERNEDPTTYAQVDGDTVECDATWFANANDSTWNDHLAEKMNEALQEFIDDMGDREAPRETEEETLPRPALRVRVR